MKNLLLKAKHKVPIYDVSLFLYVSNNAKKTYNRVCKTFKLEPDKDGFKAMAVWDGEGHFLLFFNHVQLTENAVAHECRHITDGIMRHIGQTVCKHCSITEYHAYLQGYIQAWVKQQLKRAGLRVR